MPVAFPPAPPSTSPVTETNPVPVDDPLTVPSDGEVTSEPTPPSMAVRVCESSSQYFISRLNLEFCVIVLVEPPLPPEEPPPGAPPPPPLLPPPLLSSSMPSETDWVPGNASTTKTCVS